MKNLETYKKFDFAFIVPNYNSGNNLKKVIFKLLNTNTRTNFCILIQDNNSTDSSLQFLNFLKQKKNIFIIQNKSNIGRIENWNASYANAKKLAYYGMFVFTGDSLINLNKLFYFFENKKNKNFTMIISPYLISYKNKNKISRIFNHSKENSLEFAHKLISDGNLSFGILQSNIFNLKYNLQFDNNEPFITDQIAVARYMITNPGNIFFTKVPYVKWRISMNRFHFKISIIEQANLTLKLLKFLEKEFNIEVNSKKSHTVNLLRILNFYLKFHKFNFIEFLNLLMFSFFKLNKFSFIILVRYLLSAKR